VPFLPGRAGQEKIVKQRGAGRGSASLYNIPSIDSSTVYLKPPKNYIIRTLNVFYNPP